MARVPGGERRKGPGGWTGRIALSCGLLAPLVAIGGAFAATKGVTTPFVGFRLFGSSVPLALVGIVFWLFTRIRARGERNPGARRMALGGLTLSVLVLAGIVGLALPGVGYPPINDISTDLEDPPQFVKATTFDANRDRDMSYPTAFVEQQRRGYPSLDSLELRIPSEEAFERARRALASLPNTTVTDEDPEAGRIEAIVVSRVFGFIDDVVIRVRPTDEGSLIDVRSKSRDGIGDLGVNYNRIEHLYAVLH